MDAIKTLDELRAFLDGSNFLLEVWSEGMRWHARISKWGGNGRLPCAVALVTHPYMDEAILGVVRAAQREQRRGLCNHSHGGTCDDPECYHAA